jgi:hypothetical protein
MFQNPLPLSVIKNSSPASLNVLDVHSEHNDSSQQPKYCISKLIITKVAQETNKHKRHRCAQICLHLYKNKMYNQSLIYAWPIGNNYRWSSILAI